MDHHTNTTTSSAVPEHFLCPLTLEIMTHPVQNAKTGHVFERAAILEWLYCSGGTCPLTRQSLHPADLTYRHDFQEEITVWKHGLETLSQIVSFHIPSKQDQAAHIESLMCTRNRFLARRAEKLKIASAAVQEQRQQQQQQQMNKSSVTCCVYTKNKNPQLVLRE